MREGTAEGMGWPSETKSQSDFRFQLGALAQSEESQPQCHELPYGENKMPPNQERHVVNSWGRGSWSGQRRLNDVCVSLGAVSPSVKPSDEIAAKAAAAHDRDSARGAC